MKIEHRWQAAGLIWLIALMAGAVPWMTGGGSLVPFALMIAAGAGASIMLGSDRHESAAAASPADPIGWTRRELEILALIAAGCTNDEIAAELVIALSTVKTHINNIYRKLGVSNRVQAVTRARALGVVR